MGIHVTYHAAKRMKERLGIKSSAEKQRMADLAFERGRFVEVQRFEKLGNTSANILLEYKDRVFVFSNHHSLITVLPGNKKSYETKRGLLELAIASEVRTAIALA